MNKIGEAMGAVPDNRLRAVNGGDIQKDGDFVLYWMIANRRTTWNFSLDRAIEHAQALNKPLVILEALRCGYRWASDRIHAFIIDGMADNAARTQGAPVLYYPYIEEALGAGKGLLKALSRRACVIVTDDFPCFMLPRMVEAAGGQVACRLEAVDSNGLLPMHVPDKTFTRAYSLRRWMQRNIRDHIELVPCPEPLKALELPVLNALPKDITDTWPRATEAALKGETLGALPIDHSVPVVTGTPGGAIAGERLLDDFIDKRLSAYGDDRNHPDYDVASGLSPYLHFGFVSAHAVFQAVADKESWEVDDLGTKVTGQREGFWGMSPSAESFMDELLTWRELGYNGCVRDPNYDSYEALPDWARRTLEEHAGDERPYLYDLEAFENAQTHDEIWNAAQRQLLREGRIHNYLRMLWGKKILHWTESPQQALAFMIELNNKYALDGRNPNSYSGIFWVLGRYDRAWGPVRPVFGKIRYMTSDSTRRKLKLKSYLNAFGA